MKHFLSLTLAVLLLAGCASASPPPEEPITPPPVPPAEQPVIAPAPLPELDSKPEPESDPRRKTIDRLLSSMSQEEKVGQLFFARCPKNDRGGELVAEYRLGGYLLFARDFKDKTAQEIKDQISIYQAANHLPMLIGVDEEGGTVVRVSSNPQLRETRFASPQHLYNQGGLEAVLADCREKDELLASLGINVNFAPVADLSTDPGDFIYDRTLGLGVEETCAYIAAVVDRMEADGVGSVLKHFPGYGPNRDTHTQCVVDERPLEELLAADLLPFRAGVEAAEGGTAAVLVSHNIVQSLDPDRPASLSPAVYRLLREELDFDGPVLTDDLSMSAITKYAGEGCPAVLALAAGCDMVVTDQFQEEIPQVLAAMEDGTLPMERVDEAVARVLGWKYDLGLLETEGTPWTS